MARFDATNITITFSTSQPGAVVQHQRAQLSVCVSDRLEQLWLQLVIAVAALLLAADDLLGQAVNEVRYNLDVLRLGLFITLTGVRLCFAELAAK